MKDFPIGNYDTAIVHELSRKIAILNRTVFCGFSWYYGLISNQILFRPICFGKEKQVQQKQQQLHATETKK